MWIDKWHMSFVRSVSFAFLVQSRKEVQAGGKEMN